MTTGLGATETQILLICGPFGSTFGFDVAEISAQEIDAVSVSSTKIRKALQQGDIATANSFLGYPYMLTGTVIKGKGLGRTIDYPTANLHIAENYKLIPKNGVYAVKSKVDGQIVLGMMNIGFNPTVSGAAEVEDKKTSQPQKQPAKLQGMPDEKTLRIEVHFFDFKKDLYHQEIQVDLMHRIRNEVKFDSLTALKNQLKKDKETALNLISG